MQSPAEFRHCAAVYCFTNTVNNKRYIGSTKDLQTRFRRHIYELRLRKHPNKHFEHGWHKHGEDQFTFEVLEYVDPPTHNHIRDREQFYLDLYKPEYNNHHKAYSPEGYTHSEAAREKIRQWHLQPDVIAQKQSRLRGRVVGSQERELLREALKDRIFSEETKRRMKASRKGYKPTPEAIENHRRVMFGKKHREDSINKMREAKKEWWRQKREKEASQQE